MKKVVFETKRMGFVQEDVPMEEETKKPVIVSAPADDSDEIPAATA